MLDDEHESLHTVLTMCSTLRVDGAIDRHTPDPSSPSDPRSVWIGMVRATWEDDGRTAAILKANTGRELGDSAWGPYVLVLRWIGDPPPPEIAQAVYDLIRDGGPEVRQLDGSWHPQQSSEAQSSYRAARA